MWGRHRQGLAFAGGRGASGDQESFQGQVPTPILIQAQSLCGFSPGQLISWAAWTILGPHQGGLWARSGAVWLSVWVSASVFRCPRSRGGPSLHFSFFLPSCHLTDCLVPSTTPSLVIVTEAETDAFGSKEATDCHLVRHLGTCPGDGRVYVCLGDRWG